MFKLCLMALCTTLLGFGNVEATSVIGADAPAVFNR